MSEMGLTSFETIAVWLVLLIAILGLLYAMLLRRQVMAQPKGPAKMIEVWDAIRVGADAYLSRQLKTILPFIAILTVALFLSVYIVPPTPEAMERFASMSEQQLKLTIGLGRAGAFVMGAIFSLIVGQVGMRMAVQANVRVAEAARSSFNGALRIAYRAGTVTGMLTDGLGLFGGTIIFVIFGVAAPDALLGFGFGGTLLALFMRVGGGIYTKAADVGADLVGDNVGDCAGMAADIFESYEVTIVSALILGLALRTITHHNEWLIYPLLVRGIGVLSSIVGTYLVKSEPSKTGDAMSGDAMKAIFRGFLTSAAISTTLFFIVALLYMRGVPGGWWRPFLASASGVLLAIIIDRLTDYFTGTHYPPVQEIKKGHDTGPATTILSGLGVGMESAVWATLVIAGTILIAIFLYQGVSSDPLEQFVYILYGVALAGIGMLTLTGNNVAMDSFGPISDNANGIGEMAGLEDNARQIMADLDAVGNTTKAITKGIAIGSAVIAAVALFGSFITDVGRIDPVALANGIRVSAPMVFVGFLIGGTIPWIFSSLAIKAVSRTAADIVQEVRRQFRVPGVMEGTVKPDYARPVAITTIAAQKELVNLAWLAVAAPIAVGLALQVEALGGFLAGVILSGQLLAVFMSNAGGAWDNAKKVVEDEPRDPANNLGKGSERHKAAVVGDTVGDPLKDTAGPALNPMIKVINLISLIVAPIIVTYKDDMLISIVVSLVLLASMGFVIRRSKRAPISMV